MITEKKTEGIPRWEQITIMAAAAGLVYLRNTVTKRRPAYAGGIIYYPIALGTGYVLGEMLHRFRYKKHEENLMMLEDYIRLHPEDFDEKPMKYKDVLLTWNPKR